MSAIVELFKEMTLEQCYEHHMCSVTLVNN